MSDVYRFPGVQREVNLQTFEQQLQQSYEKGLQEGLQQGYTKAYEQALQDAQAKLDEQAQLRQELATRQLKKEFDTQLHLLEMQLKTAHNKQEEGLAQAIYELVHKLCVLALDAELSLQPSHLQQAIARVLPLLQADESITQIRLSAQDYALWQSLGLSSIGDINLCADNSLSQGSVELVGLSQLHLINFKQRLEQMLPQVKLLLENPLSEPN